METGVKYALKHGAGKAWVIAFDAYELVHAKLLKAMYVEDKDASKVRMKDWIQLGFFFTTSSTAVHFLFIFSIGGGLHICAGSCLCV